MRFDHFLVWLYLPSVVFRAWVEKKVAILFVLHGSCLALTAPVLSCRLEDLLLDRWSLSCAPYRLFNGRLFYQIHPTGFVVTFVSC